MAFSEDRNRRIIPRWRSFSRTVALRELGALGRKAVPVAAFDLSGKLSELSLHPTASFAADLLATAIVTGGAAEGRRAAEILLADPREGISLAKEIANEVLRTAPKLPNPLDCPEVYNYEAVASLKGSLREYPRNPLTWCDLSLAYETLGCAEQARRSMSIALQLAPHSRHVLRCASRLFNHQDDYKYSHKLLLDSGLVGVDPWITSAEIAAASIVGRTSRFAKAARIQLDKQRLPPKHTSELASAVATLELHTGQIKKARKLFRLSLKDPTENSIAQAAWATRQCAALNIAELQQEVRQSAEARSWQLLKAGEWEESIKETERWLMDQPFSSRPAIHGSYIAITALEDYERGCLICRHGLVANPRSFGLLNNLAFAEAQLGNLVGAVAAFSQADTTQLTEVESIVWHATRGLLSYRQGRPDEGRGFYHQAMKLAKKQNDYWRLALAAANLAIEEDRAGAPGAKETIREALDLADKVSEPDIDCLVARLRELSRPDH